MPTTDPDRLVELLDHGECRDLLAGVRIGRLGFTCDALPAIQPVTFRLHGDRVVIPARAGSRMVPGTRGAVVAFQADAFDAETRTGWTVTVVGPARSVTDPVDVAALDGLPWPGALRPDRRYICVELGMVSGWRAVPDPAVAVVHPSPDGGRLRRAGHAG
ncbi:pyridoxamine 5'-phosphate oxidase family protein [Geodermatophilus marinus]|uniref:pyridoxamine 5'-phosphate oxidase family protein n=1 Tax=Geodermatophilus sp. LHW52908 TaxID=2303986 RepID=UPI001314DBB1|nr:pyridoxamine 5'-phosphate oxidase family protein [Geodermatophilus sp. LHW52908]